MAKEIERKYLISEDFSKNLKTTTLYKFIQQGYIFLGENKHLRIRITDYNKCELGLKYTNGIERDEYEYQIPFKDAKEIYDRCEYTLEKKRYVLGDMDIKYEIDEYPNGLNVVEVELPTKEYVFIKPDWFLEEISNNINYSNIELAKQNLKFILKV